MICSQCPHSDEFKLPSGSCPMWIKLGKPKAFHATGCDLLQVKAAAVKAESARVESLPDLPVYQKGVKRAEKDLQATCEGLLRQWGYRPSTAPEIVASVKPEATAVKGWYVHLNAPRGNYCILPDLLIMDAAMRNVLPIELKVCSQYQAGQREFINTGRWIECRDVPQFEEVVKAWESCIKNK